ncbi:response regulator [Tepidibacter thalassicus]|uniref:Stage 0 sporulation protein A homolog n=1 Tax=Tepidibacter thalassicus DSM 15285 TaxID=1123350 RepID=A0A1M5Q682_9FIRM|nr:response regulator [Tepidibacter thalassicus]SHH09269.1 Chemotaxis phosphatase CheX [Tepidibacter thalassicus DSM 15285]
MKKAKVVIVDDSPFSIAIIRDILIEKGFDVVGEAGSLEETIRVVEEKKPDLVTMDMTIPGTDGLECTRAVHSINPNIKVIVISSMMDDEIIKEAKKNKVSGYIQKPIDPENLITEIERVMAGEELFEELNEIYPKVFKEAFYDNMNRFTKTIPCFNDEVKENKGLSSRGISVVVGIIGKYLGRMIFDLSYETAQNMAKSILKRDVKDIHETLAMVEEFANIVAGNACSMINRRNKVYGLRVAPPTVFHGKSLNISKTELETISLVIQTDFGEMYLNVGFKRGDNEWM